MNKYKPCAPAQLIGNGKNIADLRRWLTQWEDVHIKGTGPGAGRGDLHPLRIHSHRVQQAASVAAAAAAAAPAAPAAPAVAAFTRLFRVSLTNL